MIEQINKEIILHQIKVSSSEQIAHLIMGFWANNPLPFTSQPVDNIIECSDKKP